MAPTSMATARRTGAGGDRLLEAEDHNAGERAHAHKARVAEAQLTGDAHYQIQGDGHGDIGADGHKLSLQRWIGAAGVEDLEDHEGGDDDAVGNGVAEEAVSGQKGFSYRPPHTFSRTVLPSRPEGFTNSTTISTAKTTASEILVIKALAKISMIPSRMPPAWRRGWSRSRRRPRR